MVLWRELTLTGAVTLTGVVGGGNPFTGMLWGELALCGKSWPCFWGELTLIACCVHNLIQ